VEVDDNGDIKRFAGFPEPQERNIQYEINALRAVRTGGSQDIPDDSTAPLMFASIHVMSPRIFDYIPRGIFSDSIKDSYPAAMAAGHRVTSYVGAGYWYEFSTLRRYLDISLEFLRREGKGNSIGTDSVIELGALVTDSVLWDRVKIERDAV